MRGEQVQYRLQIVNRSQVELHEVAVLASDPVALGHSRHLPGDLGDHVNVPAVRAHSHDGAERVSEGARIHLGTELQDAALRKPAQPVGDRRRGESRPAAKLGDPEPGVGLEFGDNAPGNSV